MKKLIISLVLIGALVAVAWWWRKPGGSAEPEDANPTAQVSVVSLERRPLSRQLSAYGSIESSDQGTRALSLSYDCIVRAVVVTVGSRVSAGNPLLSFAPTPDARLQLDSARSVAALAGRALASARQRFDLKLGTQDDLRSAEQAAEDANLKVESLERRGLGDSEQTLSSPFDGIVVKLDAIQGVTVPAGTNLATVASAGLLRARLGIEPSDAGLVKPGQSVTIVPVGRPGAAPITGSVSLVAAMADPATGSLDVRVPLAATDAWLPGERVEAKIEVERRTVLVAPAGAVLPVDGKDVVYTVKGGKAVRHVVTVGIRSVEGVEVSAPDLGAGDAVVVQGNYELSDGMAVTLPEKGAAAEAPPAEDAKR
jgi:membrane fusion protein, multidrug efflux system